MLIWSKKRKGMTWLRKSGHGSEDQLFLFSSNRSELYLVAFQFLRFSVGNVVTAAGAHNCPSSSSLPPNHTDPAGPSTGCQWSALLCFGLVRVALLTGFSPLCYYATLMLPLTRWSEFPTPQPCCVRTACMFLCTRHWICAPCETLNQTT